MSIKKYTYCCRLCLDDGSDHQLFDIYSVKRLDEKLLKVFNIQITTQDSCTTNICLPCFQKTLTLERQMQQFQKHKQTILSNQQRLKNVVPSPASGLCSAAPKQTKGVLNFSAKVQQTALKKSTTDVNKQLNLSSNASIAIDLNKTNARKNSSPKRKDKHATSKLSSKTPSVKKQSSLKSHSKNTEPTTAVTKPQHTVKQKSTTTKRTGTNLEKQSGSLNLSSDLTKGQNAVQQTPQSANATTVVCAKTTLASNNTAQLNRFRSNAKSSNNNVLHQTVSCNQRTDAHNTVPNLVETVQSIERNIPVHVIELQRATQETINNPQSSQKECSVEDPSVTSKGSISAPVPKLPRPGIPVSQPAVQSASSLVVNSAHTVGQLQTGLCSIPLANISTTILPYESRAVSTASTINRTETSSNLPVATTTTLTATTSAQDNAQDNAQDDAQDDSTAMATDRQPDANRGSVIDYATSPGAIKKRRHSTFIRVSSNLFDEPAEKAQFAMLNSNQFVRNVEPLLNVPLLNPFPRLPVLPEGHRVQIVHAPQTMMPFNTFNSSTMNRLSLTATASQNINVMPPIATGANFGINYGTSMPNSAANTSTFIRQPYVPSTSTQQNSVASNSSVSTNYSTYMTNNQSSSSDVRNIYNTLVSSNSSSDQQIRCCYKCNLCSSYYLLLSSLVSHLRRIHQMEKSDQNCSIVYDAEICKKILSRTRRKSIADPLLLNNNRTLMN